MKYLQEYRDPQLAQEYLREIHRITTRPWRIMEVCGGQTHSLVKNGIIEMLPEKITFIHGPGCPVCVTPRHLIDLAIYLCETAGVTLCSYGDMLRVPGGEKSLLSAKAAGADVRIVYSPLEAVKFAAEHPEKEVVFFAVGFETTAPANALSVVHAARQKLENYAILSSHVLVPPALAAILQDEECCIDGILAAGHVCTVMGFEEYFPLAAAYQVPIVVTGFEPLDLLQGILMTVRQLERGQAIVENQYARVVQKSGNIAARQAIADVFKISDRQWRGIGCIPESGLELKEAYATYDARKKYPVQMPEVNEGDTCIAGEIMKGLKKPFDCPNFGRNCKPETPLGAAMVSSEGTCAAYYHFHGDAHFSSEERSA